MKHRSLFLLAPLLAALAGCDTDPTQNLTAALDTLPLMSDAPGAAANGIGVMSYNLYVGTDLDRVMGALVSPDHGDDFPALLDGIATLQATDFPARAEAIADEIAANRPAIVGMQEVWSIAIDLHAYGVPVTIDNDFLPILQGALTRRGLNYVVAGTVTNTDAAPLPGIRVVDHDVMLVDPARVDVSAATGRSFAANIGPVAPGLTLLRGYIVVQATIDGQRYTIVNTHLESGASAQIAGLRALQAQELAAVTADAPRVILTGDLNDGDGSAMHQVLAGAGLVDAWPALRPGVAGLTCCHEPDLSDLRDGFDQRIDYVFTRGLDQPGRSLKGQIDVVGDHPADRLAGPTHPIWPSDHAGVMAVLRTN